MTNTILSDVEARAEQRRTRTRDAMWQDLVRQAWDKANEAATPAEARRWLERAHRMLPKDGAIATALAGALVRDGALAEALALFQRIATRHETAEAYTGLAAAAHVLGDPARARAALVQALRRSVPTDTVRLLATTLAPDEGWCGLTTEGTLLTSPGRPSAIRMDGVPLRLRWSGNAARLPPGWRDAAAIEVEGPAGPMLGSPLPIRAFAGAEGFVEAVEGGIEGWAWHPVDPGRDPSLQLTGPAGAITLHATEPAEGVHHERPLARPRRFRLAAAEVAALGTPLSVKGPDARHLLGSPLDPGLEARAAISPTHAGFAPIWADIAAAPARAARRRPPVDVVIPVYRGTADTLACLDSVLASIPRSTRVIVVDDASPEPDLVAALQGMARRRRILLHRLPENAGFPAAANAGIAAAPGRDVVLLNSDTLVPPGWLDRLAAAAYSAPDIGTVTPLSNDATILSYPDPTGGNPAPDLPGAIATDALAQRANAAQTVDIPVGVGFCLYLRRECLDAVGPLREDLFAQGYGEENDLCLRARHAGWRNVAATGVFVAHVGATSFGAARAHLIRRNTAILSRLHPGYEALVARHLAQNPLAPARHRMDALRWASRRPSTGAVVMVTHGGGGGVDRVVEERAAAATAAGHRAILLRPARTPGGEPAAQVAEPGPETYPNLIFPIPAGLPALAKLLRRDRPGRVELHHTLGHHHAIATLAQTLGVEQVSVLHDYARFCPRIALVSTNRHYCGEPEIAGCEACIADLGSLLEDDPPVRTLLARSAQELQHAARVIAPSADAAIRLARHFPAIRPHIEPWEDDANLPPLAPAPPGPVLRVAVVGAIGIEKGFEVLLACTRDARARRLPLEFVVVGFTADDERLMHAGPAFVTGEYQDADAVALIRAQRAQLGLIPSVWPETWCFALSRLWQAGLAVAVFDLGAQAERVRRTGRGWTLPLGLAARGVNDALLRLATASPPSQSPPQ